MKEVKRKRAEKEQINQRLLLILLMMTGFSAVSLLLDLEDPGRELGIFSPTPTEMVVGFTSMNRLAEVGFSPEAIEMVTANVFRIRVNTGENSVREGTAWLVEGGYLVTANHCIEGRINNEIMLENSTTGGPIFGRIGQIMSSSSEEDLDLAVFYVEGLDLQGGLAYGDFDYEMDQEMIVVGYPQGDYYGRLADGPYVVVDGRTPDVFSQICEQMDYSHIYLNGPYDFGGSGSPVVVRRENGRMVVIGTVLGTNVFNDTKVTRNRDLESFIQALDEIRSKNRE